MLDHSTIERPGGPCGVARTAVLGCVIDRRVYGRVRYHLLPEGESLVRVPDNVRKCVVFIGVELPAGGFRRLGTGFLLSVNLGDTGQFFPYLVTAAHILAKAAEFGDSVFISFNSIDGPAKWYSVKMSEWTLPSQDREACDVAVVPMPVPDGLDWLAFDSSSRVTPDMIRQFGIGVGDEVFVTGLFFNHAGRYRDIPIVRVGNIAAMPEEPVVTTIGNIEAYLVELRSTGGLSGSPVFVQIGPMRPDPATGRNRPASGFALLGVLHGHWDLEVPRATPKPDSRQDAIAERFNMGIGIVTPIDKVIELLNLPEHVDTRRMLEAEARRRGLPTPDLGGK